MNKSGLSVEGLLKKSLEDIKGEKVEYGDVEYFAGDVDLYHGTIELMISKDSQQAYIQPEIGMVTFK